MFISTVAKTLSKTAKLTLMVRFCGVLTQIWFPTRGNQICLCFTFAICILTAPDFNTTLYTLKLVNGVQMIIFCLILLNFGQFFYRFCVIQISPRWGTYPWDEQHFYTHVAPLGLLSADTEHYFLRVVFRKQNRRIFDRFSSESRHQMLRKLPKYHSNCPNFSNFNTNRVSAKSLLSPVAGLFSFRSFGFRFDLKVANRSSLLQGYVEI